MVLKHQMPGFLFVCFILIYTFTSDKSIFSTYNSYVKYWKGFHFIHNTGKKAHSDFFGGKRHIEMQSEMYKYKKEWNTLCHSTNLYYTSVPYFSIFFIML